MTYLTQPSIDRLKAIADCLEGGERNQKDIADTINLSRGGLIAFLARTTGRKGWPANPATIRRILRDAVIIDDQRQQASRRVSKETAFRAERAAIRDAGPDGDDRPRLPHEEIEVRIAASQAERRAYEQYWLDQERRAHGDTIQTRVGALSGMAA